MLEKKGGRLKSVFEKQYVESFSPSRDDEPSPFESQIESVSAEIVSQPVPTIPESDALTPWSSENTESGHSNLPLLGRHSRLSTFIPEHIIAGRRWIGWLISFVIGAVFGSVFIYLVMSAQPPKTVTEEKIVTKTEIVYRDAPLSETASDEVNQDRVLKHTSGKVRKDRNSAGRKGQGRNTREARKQQLLANLNVGASSKSFSGGDDEGGAGLSSAQLNKVVSSNRSSLQSCYERELKKGMASTVGDTKVTFHVTVGKSGTVTSVRLSGAGAQLPGLKTCLTQAVKRWVFPSASKPSPVQFPIVFTPAR